MHLITDTQNLTFLVGVFFWVKSLLNFVSESSTAADLSGIFSGGKSDSNSALF